jgi:FtsP/CotA-like multicopper oxidase with cupredoxin domain
LPQIAAPAGQAIVKMVGIGMADCIISPTRRHILAGLGSALLIPPAVSGARAQQRPAAMLRATVGKASWRPGADTAIWSLQPATPDAPLRFKRGDEVDLTFENQLPVPAVLNWHGLDAVAAVEPLLGRPALAASGTDLAKVPLRHAGTFMCDTRLLGDGLATQSPARALVVMETEPVTVDRDEVWLIEDVRLRPDNMAIAPGIGAADTTALYTINGGLTLDITLRPNDRLRLRIINGCQRNAIALKIENHDVRVMAIDSQPSEPFPARNGQLVFAPGTRIDVFIDATRPAGSTSTIQLHDGKEARPIARLLTSADTPLREKPLPIPAPLPSNGLPAQLDLKNALRVDLALGVPDWIRPAAMSANVAPAFRAKAGRTVVLALTNRGARPAVFHLHGHHFRLLDRLDDGWKPFWLDTLMCDPGQTQRIAFAAETAGRWLMEAMAIDWAAPRLLRSYAVD